MRKLLSALLLFAFVMTAMFQKQMVEIIFPEEPVNKSISIVVDTRENYSTLAYNDVFAQLHVTIAKISDDKRSIVWDTIYQEQKLSSFSALKNIMSREVVINNVFEKKEWLEVSYTLTYDSKGSVLQLYNQTVLNAEQNKLNIDL